MTRTTKTLGRQKPAIPKGDHVDRPTPLHRGTPLRNSRKRFSYLLPAIAEISRPDSYHKCTLGYSQLPSSHTAGTWAEHPGVDGIRNNFAPEMPHR